MTMDGPTFFDPGAERVFAAPWQARAFALTLALSERGLFTLRDFQQALIVRIGAFEKIGCVLDQTDYYTRWVEALSDLIAERSKIAASDLEQAERHATEDAVSRKVHQNNWSRDEHGRLRISPLFVDAPKVSA